jgi:PAS domain S-box-containing protein
VAGTDLFCTLAREALLRQVTRGDSERGLSQLRRRLAAAGHPAAIAWAANGQARWIDDVAPDAADASPALAAVRAGAPAQRDAHRWWLPLDHLGQRVGVMCLQAGAQSDDAALALFEPLVEAVAALTAHCGRPPQPHGDDGALLRAALHGAGTFVWEWRPDTDELSEIDEGFEMLGYARDHLAPTQDNWNRLIHPDDLAENHAAYLRHARGEVEQYEHIYRARDAAGHWRWLHERGRIVERALDGSPRRMLGTQSDITAQRELEMRAQADRERLGLIARHVPGVLYQFVQSADRSQGWFAYVSERCSAVFGVPAAALMADAAALLRRVHPDWRDRLRASLAASAARPGLWRLEFPIRRRDGADRWLLGTASPQHQADGRIEWFGYIADVTDLRELEAASRARAAAEAASRAKTEFLSRMSHELRTPLNAVLGFAQLLDLSRTPPLAEAHRRPVQMIRQAGDHLLTMIGDLLDLTRIEAGELSLNVETVPLAALADECLALVQAQAAAAQVTLAAALPGDSAVHADRTRLKQVLLNLLSNAVKYNRPGGTVTLRVAAPGPESPTLRLEVADTGVGIAPEHLARLFEPFQRGAHRYSAIEGTGIGLAVSKSLVELMGGRIDVHSTPGEGSRFVVELPTGGLPG